MRFVMNLPRKREVIETQRVFMPGSSPRANSFALRSLLDKLTDANCEYLVEHPATVALYHSGVYYARTTEWDSIPVLYSRGYGDCKSLACALVAQYRVQERKRANVVFRYVVNSKNSYDFHILVQTERGFEDPSKVLGMGNNENAWFRM